ncbi:MAG: hypothetical protein WCA95_05125 [Opitutaceae bacterium]
MNSADDGGAGPSQAERAARLRGDGLGFDDRGALIPLVEFDLQLIDGEPEAERPTIAEVALWSLPFPKSAAWFARKYGFPEWQLRREVTRARAWYRAALGKART